MSTASIDRALGPRVELMTTERPVLVTLAHHAEQHGTSVPSVDRLAEMASIAPECVTGVLRKLEDLKLIAREEHAVSGPTAWRLTLGAPAVIDTTEGIQA